MEKLVAMLVSLPDPAMVIGRDMSITFQNPASMKHIGNRLGVKCYNAVEDDCFPCADCPAVEAFEDRMHHQTLRTTEAHDSNARRYVDVSATPLIGDGGALSECVVVHRDMTCAKESETQKKDNLSMLSHDLRSPLTIIHSYTDLLLDTVREGDAETREMLSHIKRSAEVSVKLLDDFMTLSKIESGRLKLSQEEASLGMLTRSHTERFNALAREKSISIFTEFQEGLPKVRVDEKQFGRVIANIIANAIKYSEKGGSVWVRTGMHTGGADEVFLEVADEGPGINSDEIPRVMEKYYRAERQGKAQGSGLGLAIVKAITELHGGGVEIMNRPEGGTSVRVVLPTSSTH